MCVSETPCSLNRTKQAVLADHEREASATVKLGGRCGGTSERRPGELATPPANMKSECRADSVTNRVVFELENLWLVAVACRPRKPTAYRMKAQCRGSCRRGRGVRSSRRSNTEQSVPVSLLNESTRRERVGRVLAVARPDKPANLPTTKKNTGGASTSGVIMPDMVSKPTGTTSGR